MSEGHHAPPSQYFPICQFFPPCDFMLYEQQKLDASKTNFPLNINIYLILSDPAQWRRFLRGCSSNCCESIHLIIVLGQ